MFLRFLLPLPDTADVELAITESDDGVVVLEVLSVLITSVSVLMNVD